MIHSGDERGSGIRLNIRGTIARLRQPGVMAAVLTKLGERLGADWLIYNPLRMHLFHVWATADAQTVARAITETCPAARSAIDVGSGTGAFAAALRRRGVEVVALERSRVGRLYSRRQRVPTGAFDLSRDPPGRVKGTVDLAYCIEVAEHLPPDLGDRLVTFLCRLAPIIIFSAAPPGQPGSGHINCQPRAYWERRFGQCGYALDGEATDALTSRVRAVTACWWLRTNFVVFSRL